jgi:serine/threonine protein kinase/Tfp pilus assembly protein PilF
MVMLNKIILHYKILEKIGAGGMGVVYKAWDLKLERAVAIKFLPRQIAASKNERERFKKEAKAAASLNHPNIATIHTIEKVENEMFMVMEYIDGKELKKIIKSRDAMILSFNEVVDITLQIAVGIQAAHKKGIVHRDIKSSNIMITKTGTVKIMDFGLAEISGKEKVIDSTSTLGTVGYMSPEQVVGSKVDERSDIWSFGVVLYEMLQGRLPFKGRYEPELIYSIINMKQDELNPKIPAAMRHLVDQCLQKKVNERIATMTEVIARLNTMISEISDQKLKERATFSRKRIAILPFSNLSRDTADQYFAEGLTEELILTLSKVTELRIISRTSVLQYQGTKKSIKDIAGELKVGSVIQGSIRKQEENLRITIQLIDTQSEEVIWSQEYDRMMKDIFVIQRDIATEITEALKVRLLGNEEQEITQSATENIEAYHLYLKGRYHWNKRTKESLHKSVTYLEQAVAEDPNYAMAWAGLSDSYIILGDYDYLLPHEAYPKARAAVEVALKLNPSLSQAHTSLGHINAVYDWHWKDAEEEFKLALELDDNYATNHHWYAINYLVPHGKFDAAQSAINQALELDPLSLIINVTGGMIHYYSGRYDDAIMQYQKTLELEPQFGVAYYFLSWALTQNDAYEDAMKAMKNAISILGSNLNLRVEEGYIWAASGDQLQAKKILSEIEASDQNTITPYVMYAIAALRAKLNQTEKAIQILQDAYEKRSYRLIYLNVDPWFESLKSIPEVKALISNLGLTTR